MIEHSDKRSEMENAAKRTFDTEFNFDVLAKAYTDYYRRIQ